MRNVLKIHLLSPFLLLGFVETLVLLTAVYVGFYVGHMDVSGWPDTLVDRLPEAGVFVGVMLITKFAVGLYHWEYITQFLQIFIRIAATFIIGFIILSMIFYVFPVVEIWRASMAITMPLAFAGLVTTRWGFYQIPELSYLKRRVLVIGVGEQAARIQQLEDQGKAYRFVAVAFIDVTGEEPKVDPSLITGNVNSLADFVAKKGVDEIVVAVQDRRGRLPLRSLMDCRLAGTPVSDYQTFCERETGRIDLDALRPDWFVFSDGFPGGKLQQSLKRGLDLGVSAVTLFLLLPLLLATAFAIWIETGRPIFYRQQRVGFRGKPYELMKFRSMRVDAEKDGVPKWAQRNDDRITTVGAFIRKTRIDEIPQLFNVLRGDMSFVGPRPERPFFVDQLTQIIPYYEIRHRVKPGITGWAQVNYPYGASVEDAWHKLQYDLYYIKSYSVFRDLIIILQTIRVIIFPQGAR